MNRDNREDALEPCPECRNSVPRSDKSWVKDRYGNPYRKVCSGCYGKVRAEILKWYFDASDAGESLEGEE